MGMPAARVGDMHVCPMVTPGVPPIPHVGGPVLPPGGITVLIAGMPAARVSDMCVCVGPPDVVALGSFTVLIANLPAARLGPGDLRCAVTAAARPSTRSASCATSTRP